MRLRTLPRKKNFKHTTHVNMLKHYNGPEPEIADLEELNLSDPDVYRAHKILDHKREDGELFFLVDWCPSKGMTYQPSWENSRNCSKALIDAYRLHRDVNT